MKKDIFNLDGEIFADQLGGRWCEVSGNKVWVVEW